MSIGLAAQQGLYDTIKDTEGWTVSDGEPGIKDAYHIWVTEDVFGWEFSDRTTGMTAQDQEFEVSAIVYCKVAGLTHPEMRTRIDGAIDAITAAIQSDRTLNGTVGAARLSRSEVAGGLADENGQTRIGVAQLWVNCKSWA